MRTFNRLILGENYTEKKSLVEWDDECQEAFSKLKGLSSDMPVHAYTDYLRPLKPHTDMSEVGLGAYLYQSQDDGMERVIAYANQRVADMAKYNFQLHY